MDKVAQLEEAKEVFQGLLSHPGWVRLHDVIKEQIRLGRQHIFTQELRSQDDVFSLVQMRGQVAGLQLALALPESFIDDLDAEIRTIRQEQKEHDDGSTGSNSTSP